MSAMYHKTKLQMENYFTRCLGMLSLSSVCAEGKILEDLVEVGVETEPALPEVRERLRQPDVAVVEEVVAAVDEQMLV